MSKTPRTPKAKTLAAPPAPAHTPADKARMALMPSVNGASVIEAYQANLMGKDADINAMIDGLRETSKEVKGGDLHLMESMLISQATALQTIFTSLARRAVNQEHLKQYETFLGLALKAQSQSRATISALVDLKYPRQAMFVKQANIAHGPQQVNNSAAPDGELSHAREKQIPQNKLLEADHGQPGVGMDTERRKRQAEMIQRWKPWAKSTGPKSPKGKAAVSRNAFTGGELVQLRQITKEMNQAVRDQRHGLDRIN